MTNTSIYYQESGNINTPGLIAAYILYLAVTLVLGYAYTVFSLFIPFIYFTFIATIGFSLLLGLMCRLMIRMTHNRNKKSQMIQAVIVGVLANYFQWTAYIAFAYSGEIPSFTEFLSAISWIVIPVNFIEALVEINSIGLWSVFGIPFNGFALAFVWLLEAFIIMAGPVLAVRKAVPQPYSEASSKWFPMYTLEKEFESISPSETIITALTTDALNTLKQLGLGSGTRHTKVHLFYLENESLQFLTVEKIFYEDRGKGKKNSDVIIKNIAIDTKSAQNILNEFRHHKKSVSFLG